MPGTTRQSISMRHLSGTMLILLPPEIVPTFRVGLPSLACACAVQPGMIFSSMISKARRMA
jgi:hypothetical protein